MNITQTLNKTAGRFTTLVVNKNSTNTSFCARIYNVTAKTVRFYDVNSEVYRVVPTSNIVYARSGKLRYGKSVSK
jgi:hypothetical protein